MNTEDMFPVNPYITNYNLYSRWKTIEKFLTNYHTYKETRGGLIINEQFYWVLALQPGQLPAPIR